LQGAYLVRANLRVANLQEVNLRGADLSDAKGVTVEELEQATDSLAGATMPDGKKHE
ncbi:MAG: pentapeptide repeat-containing protein, partial [Acidobacteria bacterium]|nr:pentapeptide repeat-containing protein [Acidobacteriota bacterium]